MVYRFTVHLTGYSRFSQPRKIAKQRPCIWMDWTMTQRERWLIEDGSYSLFVFSHFHFYPYHFSNIFLLFFFLQNFCNLGTFLDTLFLFCVSLGSIKRKFFPLPLFSFVVGLLQFFVADLWSPLPSLKVTPLLLLKDDNATLIRFCVWVLQIYQVAEVVEMHDAKWVIWGFVCLSFRKLNSSVVLHFSIVNGFVHGLLVGFGSLMSFWAPGC